MKYLNNYKLFESKEEISDICYKYRISNYTINEDGSIDVKTNIRLSNVSHKMPLNFNKIHGFFDCTGCNLVSLEGCPKYVDGYFSCSNNKLTSLEGSPKYVDGCFYCTNNKITSLEGCPEYIYGEFHCAGNPIYSIVQYFIDRKDKDINTLIELFNYYDIVQGMNVIYDRLKYFYETIDFELTDNILTNIEDNGYKIIY